MSSDTLLFEVTTEYGQYQVVDTVYDGRPARVLFSGDHIAAQSGMPTDGKPDLLFDYNQRLFELAEQLKPAKVLVVGGGAFTLPTALAAALPEATIDVIEQDGALIALSEKYFNLVQTDRLQIIEGEGRAFLDSTADKYDLIIIDAFSHVQMPRGLATKQAIASMARALTADGVVAINIIAAYRGRRTSPLLRLTAAFEENFKQITLYPANPSISLWSAQNFILAGQQAGVAPELRFSPIELLETLPEDVLDDSQIQDA